MSHSHQGAFERLRSYDTPTVLNVIELLDRQPRDTGFTDGTIRAIYPELPPAVGYATTASFRSSRPADGDPGGYRGFMEQIESFLGRGDDGGAVAAPRIVVFQDLDGTPVGATFGEVMCTVYRAFGCIGLITSGAARDIDQVRSLRFPCWASSVIASHAYCRIVEFGVPVTVGGLRIAPGDILHADVNGVAVLPPGAAETIADGCQEMVAAEEDLLRVVRRGSPDLAVVKDARKRSVERIAALGRRLRGESA